MSVVLCAQQMTTVRYINKKIQQERFFRKNRDLVGCAVAEKTETVRGGIKVTEYIQVGSLPSPAETCQVAI